MELLLREIFGALRRAVRMQYEQLRRMRFALLLADGKRTGFGTPGAPRISRTPLRLFGRDHYRRRLA